MTIRDIERGLVRPHELYGDHWFNSDPISILNQKGNVLLLDFWDFSCVGSLHTVPYIRDWHRKYAPEGLIVVGVHTPRFSFGRDETNLDRAIKRLSIRYPVVMDNDATIWSRYGSRQWPSQYLIDRDGFIRLANTGEGSYTAIEHMIQTLMLDAGLLTTVPELTEPMRTADMPGTVCFRATPELFAGYLRGSMGNVEGSVPEAEMHYDDPGIYLEGKFYVAGDWSVDREDLTLIGETEGEILVRYAGLEVYAVVGAVQNEPVELEVLQDGHPLTAEDRGSDVKILQDKRSVVRVAEPRAYQLVRNKDHGDHLLKCTARKGGIALYCLSFTPGVIPELIPG